MPFAANLSKKIKEMILLIMGKEIMLREKKEGKDVSQYLKLPETK